MVKTADLTEKYVKERFAKIREDNRLPPSVIDELETKVQRLSGLTKKEIDDICNEDIASYEDSLVEPRQ